MAAEAIECPECSKKFKGKGDLRGKKIKCPFCKHPFTVPEDDPAEQQNAAVQVIAMAADEEDDPKAGYGVTAQDLSPRCPNCANEMESKDAIICLFCGYNTLTRTWGKTEKVKAVSFGKHFLYLLPAMLAVLFLILQLLFLLYYCLIMPYHVANAAWLSWTDHESMRMWTVFTTMFDVWPIGIYAYKRLILEPKPKEESLD